MVSNESSALQHLLVILSKQHKIDVEYKDNRYYIIGPHIDWILTEKQIYVLFWSLYRDIKSLFCQNDSFDIAINFTLKEIIGNEVNRDFFHDDKGPEIYLNKGYLDFDLNMFSVDQSISLSLASAIFITLNDFSCKCGKHSVRHIKSTDVLYNAVMKNASDHNYVLVSRSHYEKMPPELLRG